MPQRWVLAAATLGAALVILDVTAMNVVAPVIQRELEAPVAVLQWVLNAYLLFLASVLLLGGALADRYGRRRIFAIGVAIFAVAAASCALAPNAWTLIAARAFQGLGAALLMPAGLALLAAHHPGAERGRAIGIWGGLSGLAAVAGPLLGGVLADYLSWRWYFLLYLPVALVLLVILWRRVPAAPQPPSDGPLDLLGSGLVTLGLFAVVFALIRAPATGWSDAVVLAGLGIGGALLWTFSIHERWVRNPLIDPRRFRDRDYGGAQLATLFIYLALAAGMLFVPMRLMYLEGWRPALAGAAVVPTVLLIALLSPRIGAALPQRGARPLVILGGLVCCAGYLVLAVPAAGTSYWLGTFWGLMLVGAGMAFVIAPITATVLGAVPPAEAARAAGVNNAVSRLGALIAITIAGVIALAAHGVVFEAGLPAVGLEAADEAAARAARLDYAAAEPPPGLAPEAHATLQALYHDAFLAGYRAVQLAMAGFAVLGALAAIRLTRHAGRS